MRDGCGGGGVQCNASRLAMQYVVGDTILFC